jgi:hypothetical protein
LSIEKIDKAKTYLSCRLIAGIARIASALEAVLAYKKAFTLCPILFLPILS